MSYAVLVSKRAKKDIDKLDKVVSKQIKAKILLLQDNPIGLSRKLVNSDLGMYRYRIGNYRVVFDLSDKVILILRIGHRREIYR